MGFDAARGDLVVTMDGDLQDDPADIPKFLQRIHDGCDVVSGWKRKRRDPFTRVLGSRLFNWLVRRMTGVPLHDHNCGFKCCRRVILPELHLYGELHRFIPVQAASLGYQVGEVEVNHRRRPYGKSKYGLGRIPKGLLDLVTVQFVTGFRYRPQHLLGTIGLVGFAVGGLGILLLTVWWFLSRSALLPGIEPIHLHRRPIFYFALTALILGSQFMAVGFLAELLVALLKPDVVSSHVSVAERAGFDAADDEVSGDHGSSRPRGPAQHEQAQGNEP
jgi:dolichol-phosphate mannosyltransferase